MQLFLLISLLVVALLLIGIILIQQGKGAEMGASFGAGGSNTLFGAPGAGNFLTKSTTVLAILFFVIALAITAVKKRSVEESTLLDDAAQGIESSEPAVEASEGLQAIPTGDQEEGSVDALSSEGLSSELPAINELEEKAAAAISEVNSDVSAAAKEATDALQEKVTDGVTESASTLEAKLEGAKEAVEEKTDGKD